VPSSRPDPGLGFLREGARVVGVRADRPRDRHRPRGPGPRRGQRGRGLDRRRRGACSAARRSLDVEASKGIHLVVPRDRIRSECGFITKTERSVLFVIPWGRHWIIGTTDTRVEPRPRHPAAVADRHRLPARARQHAAQVPLDHDDVEGVYAGLRPLLRQAGAGSVG
jgi:glycerol-3-phosphate dehydrogenase